MDLEFFSRRLTAFDYSEFGMFAAPKVQTVQGSDGVDQRGLNSLYHFFHLDSAHASSP
jgi:hypothetical protein